jgi:hypothetical protein
MPEMRKRPFSRSPFEGRFTLALLLGAEADGRPKMHISSSGVVAKS